MSVPGRSGRGPRRGGGLDEPQGDGLHQPGGPHESSASGHRGAQPSRTHHPQHRSRSPLARKATRARGPAHAEVKGVGDQPDGPELVHGSPSGADPGPRGIAHRAQRAPTVGQERAAGAEASGDDRKDEAYQIGTRRRGEQARAPRDARPLSVPERTRGGDRPASIFRGESEDHPGQEGRGSDRRSRGTIRARSTAPLREERERILVRREEGQGEGEGEGKEQGEEPHAQPEAPGDMSEQPGDWAKAGEEAMGVLRSWLQSEECGDLTVSQTGALLTLLIQEREQSGRLPWASPGARARRRRGGRQAAEPDAPASMERRPGRAREGD